MIRNRGMTLIELLVAVFAFAVMSTLAYSALGQMLSNSDVLNSRMQRVQEVQLAMRYLESDLLQTAPRPVRDELGENYRLAIQSDLSSQFALELTHSGWSNPAGLPRSTQQRVAYQLVDGELLRYHWYVLDRTFSNEPVETVLIDNADSLLFRFLDASGEWTEQWPPQSASQVVSLTNRPRAVEIRLTLADEGEIRRIVEVAP
ncbi:MAG: type II secretion system minor pseudopilin GspJ [Woeseiaceae bacterium]|jgi:general secretion pathway protein J|nr:type II secretion system minor pseudopilin GspJ [Woeseiaceae bacterium]